MMFILALISLVLISCLTDGREIGYGNYSQVMNLFGQFNISKAAISPDRSVIVTKGGKSQQSICIVYKRQNQTSEYKQMIQIDSKKLSSPIYVSQYNQVVLTIGNNVEIIRYNETTQNFSLSDSFLTISQSDILTIQMTNNCDSVIIGYYSGQVEVYSRNEYGFFTYRYTLNDSILPINDLDVSQDGVLLITGSDDYRGRLYDQVGGQFVLSKVLSDAKLPIISTAISNNRTMVITGSLKIARIYFRIDIFFKDVPQLINLTLPIRQIQICLSGQFISLIRDQDALMYRLEGDSYVYVQSIKLPQNDVIVTGKFVNHSFICIGYSGYGYVYEQIKCQDDEIFVEHSCIKKQFQFPIYAIVIIVSGVALIAVIGLICYCKKKKQPNTDSMVSSFRILTDEEAAEERRKQLRESIQEQNYIKIQEKDVYKPQSEVINEVINEVVDKNSEKGDKTKKPKIITKKK